MVGLGAAGGQHRVAAPALGVRQQKFQLADLVASQGHAAKVVPLDRVLLETDSPYMAPVPVRGTRNDSRNVSHIAAKFAEIRGMSTDEIIALTNENGRRFFGIQSVKEERS